MALTLVHKEPGVRTNVAYGTILFTESDEAGARTFNLGFDPVYVRVVNLVDRTMMEWFYGMTSGHAIKTVAAGTRTLITSNGITVDGDRKIIVGNDTDVLTEDDKASWMAMA